MRTKMSCKVLFSLKICETMSTHELLRAVFRFMGYQLLFRHKLRLAFFASMYQVLSTISGF